MCGGTTRQLFGAFFPCDRHIGYSLGEREVEVDQASQSVTQGAAAGVELSQESQSSGHVIKSLDHVTSSQHLAAGIGEFQNDDVVDLIEDFDDDSNW